MPSALLTLIQTSLLQQAKLSCDNDDSKLSCAGDESESAASSATKEHLNVVAIGRPASSTMGPPGSKGAFGGDFAALLQDLVKVVQELAHMDAMLIEAETNSPETEEAQKWHDVSLRALMWSREALAERQATVLANIKARVETPPMLSTTSSCKLEAERTTMATQAVSLQDKTLVGSLRNDLERLKMYDRERCLLVRNIKKLGLSSQQRLQAHFERYGAVSEVLVAHSFEKPSAKRRLGRVRPATKGFVVMEESAAARAVLEAGEAHMVEDDDQLHEVIVQHFNPFVAEGLDEEA